jgi:6-methylsalicylate decarboxylase
VSFPFIHRDHGIVSGHESTLTGAKGWTRRDLLMAAGAMTLSAALGPAESRAQSGDVNGPERKVFKHIDVHHHFIPPQYLKEGPPSVAISKVDGWSPAHAIEDMERTGIGISVLSFSSPFLWFSGLDSGRRLARLCNDYCAEMARDYPHRFGSFAGLPPLPDSEGCLKEIEYALDTLHAHGVTVMTSYGSSWLGDPAFAPVWDELNRRQALVFVHPAIPTCCGALGQGFSPGYLELPFDTARTVASLWFSGGFSRWPNIRFIFSHGGGALPMVADRIDKLGRPGKEPGLLLHDAAPLFDRLYFDTANAANRAAFAGLRAFANPNRILFGSDYPYVPLDRGVDDLARSEMSARERRAIACDNALALMPSLAT